jgi:hypothetical protein
LTAAAVKGCTLRKSLAASVDVLMRKFWLFQAWTRLRMVRDIRHLSGR